MTATVSSLESAVLRTCRKIYSEALPIFYGENTFLYHFWTPSFSYGWVSRFADSHLKTMRHLELQINVKPRHEEMAAATVAATIQYFIKHDCDLHTLKLELHERDFDGIGHPMLRKVTASQEVMAALAELKVSKALTITFSYWTFDSFNHPCLKSLGNRFQDFVNRLASRKEMAATKQELKIAYEGPDRDGLEEDFDEDEDRYISLYELPWCLRPRHSEQQKAKIAMQAIEETGDTL